MVEEEGEKAKKAQNKKKHCLGNLFLFQRYIINAMPAGEMAHVVCGCGRER